MASGDPSKQTAVFRPEVFDVSTIEQAKRIIVTPETGTTTEERWEKETGYLVEDIGQHLAAMPDATVVDYGCGIGRVAKGLIDRGGCRVAGVDFSPSMRLLAPDYVLSDRFVVWSPDTLDKMIAKGYRADLVVCLWVIQHVLDPQDVIARIGRTLRPGGLLYTLNQEIRCVPSSLGWVNDGFDMRSALCAAFEEEDFHSLPEAVTTPILARHSMIQVLRKRA